MNNTNICTGGHLVHLKFYDSNLISISKGDNNESIMVMGKGVNTKIVEECSSLLLEFAPDFNLLFKGS